MPQPLNHYTCSWSTREIRVAPMVLGYVLCFSLACAVIPAWAQSMDAVGKDQDKESLVLEKDKRTGDRMIMVSPPEVDSEDSTMIIHRDPGTGDMVIHVAPPREQKQEADIIIGPLFITPEITWPDQGKPHKDNRR